MLSGLSNAHDHTYACKCKCLCHCIYRVMPSVHLSFYVMLECADVCVWSHAFVCVYVCVCACVCVCMCACACVCACVAFVDIL